MDNDPKFIGVLITAGAFLLVGVVNYFHQRRLLKETKLAERRKQLIAMLNEFYGPFYSYLTVVKAVSRLLFEGKPKEFRTLTYLLDPQQEYETEKGRQRVVLTDSDKHLIEEIIELEKKLEDLIATKAGLIDDPSLMFQYVPDPKRTDVDLSEMKVGLLALAITHFRVIRMAYEGRIRSEPERYKNFVYPRELDDKIYGQISALQSELKALGT